MYTSIPRYITQEHPSIGGYWNISGAPVLLENVIFTFFRTCLCYPKAYNTGMQKWCSIIQYVYQYPGLKVYTFSKNQYRS